MRFNVLEDPSITEHVSKKSVTRNEDVQLGLSVSGTSMHPDHESQTKKIKFLYKRGYHNTMLVFLLQTKQ